MGWIDRGNLRGPAGAIDTATASALPTTAQPTVTLGGTPEHRTMAFGIPRANSVVSSVINGAGHLIVTLLDGQIIDTGLARGPQGLDGVNAVANDTATAGYIGTLGTSETLTALESRFARVITPEQYGAVGDGVADDTAAINAALASATGGGVGVYFPKTYRISDALLVPAGTEVWGTGKADQILQTAWPVPVFDVGENDDVTIHDIRAKNLSTRVQTGYMTLTRGNWSKNMSSFVVSHGHRTKVYRCGEENFEIGVNLINWNSAAGARQGQMVGCVVDDFEVADSFVGVFATGFKGLTVTKVRGWYAQASDGTQASHLFYLGDSTEVTPNMGLIVSDCHATFGRVGNAFQIKNVNGGSVTNITADDCSGLISFADLRNVTMTGLVSTNDVYADVYGSIAGDGVLEGVKIVAPVVRLLGDGVAIRLLAGTNCSLSDPLVTVVHTTAQPADTFDIAVTGSWTVTNPTVINTGAQSRDAIGLFTGDGGAIRKPRTEGSRVGVTIRGSVTNGTVEAEPGAIKPHATYGLHPLQNTSPTSRIITPKTRHLHEPSYLSINGFETGSGSTSYLSGADFGPTWLTPTGTWSCRDGKLKVTVVATSVAYVDVATTDVEVSSEFIWQDNTGLVFRAIDASNRLSARITSVGNLELVKRATSVDTVLATTAFVAVAGDRIAMRIAVRGTKIRVYVNGLLLITYTLAGGDATTFATATQFGVVTVLTNAWFESFSVRKFS